jgi:hypothetical protein
MKKVIICIQNSLVRCLETIILLYFLILKWKGKAPICFVKIRIHVDWRKLLI